MERILRGIMIEKQYIFMKAPNDKLIFKEILNLSMYEGSEESKDI